MQAVLAAAMLPWSVQLSDVTAWPSTQPDRYLPSEKPQHTMGRGAVGGGEGGGGEGGGKGEGGAAGGGLGAASGG
jgi:hypothetical protein